MRNRRVTPQPTVGKGASPCGEAPNSSNRQPQTHPKRRRNPPKDCRVQLMSERCGGRRCNHQQFHAVSFCSRALSPSGRLSGDVLQPTTSRRSAQSNRAATRKRREINKADEPTAAIPDAKNIRIEPHGGDSGGLCPSSAVADARPLRRGWFNALVAGDLPIEKSPTCMPKTESSVTESARLSIRLRQVT